MVLLLRLGRFPPPLPSPPLPSLPPLPRPWPAAVTFIIALARTNLLPVRPPVSSWPALFPRSPTPPNTLPQLPNPPTHQGQRPQHAPEQRLHLTTTTSTTTTSLRPLLSSLLHLSPSSPHLTSPLPPFLRLQDHNDYRRAACLHASLRVVNPTNATASGGL